MMDLLTSNLQFILNKKGSSLEQFFENIGVSKVSDLTLEQIKIFCKKENLSFTNLILYNLAFDKEKTNKIKLLILDVDGVMTDGGMYFTAKGDQIKKYNTKDGRGILNLKKSGIEVGIISSGIQLEVVKYRADLLKIKHLYVGEEPKLKILKQWCDKLNIDFSNVGIIGDDINDLEIMELAGFSAAPADAVDIVKSKVDLVLRKNGGEGCVRELIDYIL